jgi:hypothetical protein
LRADSERNLSAISRLFPGGSAPRPDARRDGLGGDLEEVWRPIWAS